MRSSTLRVRMRSSITIRLPITNNPFETRIHIIIIILLSFQELQPLDDGEVYEPLFLQPTLQLGITVF